MLGLQGTSARARRYFMGSSALAMALACLSPASAQTEKAALDIPAQPLTSALQTFSVQANTQVLFSDDILAGRKAPELKGQFTPAEALAILTRGTGLRVAQSSDHVYLIEVADKKPAPSQEPAPSVETVVVTAEKKSENIQQVPIAITALSQKELTERQVAGGPDLVKEVPNLTFSKTNFTGYNLEIRGVGTQAISVTTDPAVAVAFNDTPFIRNHFFEQEFYDLGDLEVLRGPQGTLYGRNATGGVVNIKSALPTDQYEAMLSADIGNYSNRRLEGMLNLPIDGDTLDLRIAGEWTKRDGYTEDTTLGTPVDGRDLWSSRVTLGWKPASNVQTYLVWEHFSEDDDRLRSGKQLCKTAPIPTSVGGVTVPTGSLENYQAIPDFLSQGCEDTSLYSPSAFEVPNGYSLTYYAAVGVFAPTQTGGFNVYSETTQSPNLRDIQSAILPQYLAKNDTVEYNVKWEVSPALTFTSQTGYNSDFLWSSEDYDRFDSAPGAFADNAALDIPDPQAGKNGVPANSALFCDPQLGCSDRLILQDLSRERAWQLSQEFRLASNFSGPLNFSIGANLLHYETVEDYYVFINSLTATAAGIAAQQPDGQALAYTAGPTTACVVGSFKYTSQLVPGELFQCPYIDPNPISSLNNQGHNYFLSQNPYVLNSYAAFGEVYYNLTHDLKFTAGLRFTDDQKHFVEIPSELLIPGYGYPVSGSLDQKWDRLTGRAVLDWTPNLDFTDTSLVYLSYAHGYKAGGANPPGAFYPYVAALGLTALTLNPIHPLTFRPEYIESLELGTKNTLLDGALTLNADVFYYNYSNYQISEIVDRTAINNNYNSHMEGGEFEANWEPLPGLKFSLAQGFENTGLAGGDRGIDLMDRTAGNPNWIAVKPYVTVSSNCILPTYVVGALMSHDNPYSWCSDAYSSQLDPVTGLPYTPNPSVSKDGPVPAGYPGFNPATAPNNGEGFSKNLGGNQLPNAPHFTTSLTAEYTIPVSEDWAATLHADFYWQSQQFARVFEDAIDRIHGYSNVNFSLILTSANGWQVMGYVKNVFDTTAISGTFLNSDDTGLTTNVFLTDPRLFGVRVTKHLDQNDGFWGSDYSGYEFFTGLFSDTDNGRPPLWIELGGQLAALDNSRTPIGLPFAADYAGGRSPLEAQRPPHFGLDEEAKITYQPNGSDWIFSGGVQFGRMTVNRHQHLQTANKIIPVSLNLMPYYNTVFTRSYYPSRHAKFADTQAGQTVSHTIIDFLVGKDVGLGGLPGSSTLSGGVRVAQFVAKNSVGLRAEPDLQYPTAPITNFAQKYQFNNTHLRFHDYTQNAERSESFHGLGPKLAWNASTPIVGDAAGNGEVTLDWGASFAVLFGKQRMREHQQTTIRSYYMTQWHPGASGKPNGHGGRIKGGGFGRGNYFGTLHDLLVPPTAQHTNRASHARSRMVAVPNVGALFGLSYKYNNAKISFGYRADEFFGAMDGGIATHKSYNEGFNGPYATISIGLGG